MHHTTLCHELAHQAFAVRQSAAKPRHVGRNTTHIGRGCTCKAVFIGHGVHQGLMHVYVLGVCGNICQCECCWAT